MKDTTPNEITNNDGSSSCPAPTDETPAPALYTKEGMQEVAAELRDVLGDPICDMPKHKSDKIESTENDVVLTCLTGDTIVNFYEPDYDIYDKESDYYYDCLADSYAPPYKYNGTNDNINDSFVLTRRRADELDVSPEHLCRDGIPTAFFYGRYAIELGDMKNDKQLDALEYSDKHDAAYIKTLNSSIVSTSSYFPSFITETVIPKVMKFDSCTKRMAWVYTLVSGLSQTMLDFNEPNYKTMGTHRESIATIQVGASLANNVSRSMKYTLGLIDEVDVRGQKGISKKTTYYLLEMISSFIDTLCDTTGLTKTDATCVLVYNGVLKSKPILNKRKTKTNQIFDDVVKTTAKNNKMLILDGVTEVADNLAYAHRSLYKHYLIDLTPEYVKEVEDNIKSIDKIIGTKHCKYCLSNNTKLRRHNSGKYKKDQHKCNSCGRTFSCPVDY